MTAEEARKLAEQKQGRALIPILDFIKKTAENGAFEVWIYDSINPTTKKELEQLGYQVGDTLFDPREQGCQTKISW